ncbi:MAG: hypothetical protein MUP55_03480 [Candidatus Aenigmarchaeota archaeon]|nr:hypothetical protein [Candidatus Aenigmarchaeota archaeon]
MDIKREVLKKKVLLDPKDPEIKFELPEYTQRKTTHHQRCYLQMMDMQTGELYDLRKEKGNRLILGEEDFKKDGPGDSAYIFMHPSGALLMHVLKSEKGTRIAGEHIGPDLKIIDCKYEFCIIEVGNKYKWRVMPRNPAKIKKYFNQQ